VLLAVQNHVMTDRTYTIGGYLASSFATQELSSKYDLSFYVESGANDLAIAVEYCTDLFEASTIDRMLTHVEAILSQLVSAPDQLVGGLSLLSIAEGQRVVTDFNQTAQTYDMNLPVHVQSILQAQVEINTVLEEQIAALVCQVLRVDSVGMTDNLFERGLNSIRVIALHKLLTTAHPVSLDIHEIFSNPTVRQLTQLIGSRFDSQPAMVVTQTEEIDF